MTVARSAVIHAHFYQPAREEPWLDLVERDRGAAPWHDWNERIERECYRAVVAARRPGADGRIARIVNTLKHMSFNVGPTLLSWLASHAPRTYTAILAADQASQARLGHGNAMAMPYHHIILPLASRREKTTEVRWGIADFVRRFGRTPSGMWLPETAVDTETLDVLASEGVGFTVLAPHQVTSVPPFGRPGTFRTPSGRTIAIFVYDGPLSHDVAFGPIVRDGALWANRMLGAPGDETGASLVSLATDGETFGHHHRFGEMALAAALEGLSNAPAVTVENFASFLARHPPETEVTLVEPSSWSCTHGVERWRANCGCQIAPEFGWHQGWRAPLRQALEELADGLHAVFAAEGAQYFEDPWAARDALAGLLSEPTIPTRARDLLEMERNALRMFTSCGWFFDDIGGVESLICLRYAARALELAGSAGDALEAALRTRLAEARSNDPEVGSGMDIWDRTIRSRHRAECLAAAAIAALQASDPETVPSVFGAFDVSWIDGVVRVLDRRSGRGTRFTTEVRGKESYDLAILLQDEDGRTTEIGLAELPEPAREVIRRTRSVSLLKTLLAQSARDAVSTGQVPLRVAIQEALLRHLDPGPERLNIAALAAGLELLALEGEPAPFDAQTRYYHLMRRAAPRERELLLPLAPRFGFASHAFATPAS